MRKLLSAYIILLISLTAVAKTSPSDLPKVTFGAEWGYFASFATAFHYNFFDPEGFRVDRKDIDWSYMNNGEVSLHCGYNFNKHWNLAMYMGYSGGGDFHPVIPISIRATRYFGDSHMSDRWFSFLDFGSGISVKKQPQEILSGKIGGGYRLSLSRHTKLDFLTAFRLIYTHPEIFQYGEFISRSDINRNDGYVASLFLGISLTF